MSRSDYVQALGEALEALLAKHGEVWIEEDEDGHASAWSSPGGTHLCPIPPPKPAEDAPTQRGLYGKFRVERVDGRDRPGGDKEGAVYFVLDTTHDPFAAPALRAYADACADGYPALSRDLMGLAGSKPAEYAPQEQEPSEDYKRGYIDGQRYAIKSARIAKQEQEPDAVAEVEWLLRQMRNRDLQTIRNIGETYPTDREKGGPDAD